MTNNIKVTKNQLSFLDDATRKAEEENMIGYPNSIGQLSQTDEEIKDMVKFLNSLKPGQVLTKEG